MKKILYFSALSLFFSCYLQAQQVSQNSEKAKPSSKSVNKKENKNRRLANKTALFSKTEVLGEDYYKDLDSEPIRREVGIHLKAIENLCETKRTLSEKINSLNDSFQALKDLIIDYLNESNLGTDDALFLRGIKANISIDSISYGRPITEKFVKEIDIRKQFLIAYRGHYGLPEDMSAEKLPHEWAKQIYNGLNCLYKKQL